MTRLLPHGASARRGLRCDGQLKHKLRLAFGKAKLSSYLIRDLVYVLQVFYENCCRVGHRVLGIVGALPA